MKRCLEETEPDPGAKVQAAVVDLVFAAAEKAGKAPALKASAGLVTAPAAAERVFAVGNQRTRDHMVEAEQLSRILKEVCICLEEIARVQWERDPVPAEASACAVATGCRATRIRSVRVVFGSGLGVSV